MKISNFYIKYYNILVYFFFVKISDFTYFFTIFYYNFVIINFIYISMLKFIFEYKVKLIMNLY